MLYYTILYYTVLCYIMRCYTILYYTILYYTIRRISPSYNAVMCSVLILYCIYYTILCYTMLCHCYCAMYHAYSTRTCTLLCCTILYCTHSTALYSTILYSLYSTLLESVDRLSPELALLLLAASRCDSTCRRSVSVLPEFDLPGTQNIVYRYCTVLY